MHNEIKVVVTSGNLVYMVDNWRGINLARCNILSVIENVLLVFHIY